jgi:hypothetical protein
MNGRRRPTDVHTDVHMWKSPSGMGLVNVVNIVNIFQGSERKLLSRIDYGINSERLHARG